MTVMYVNICDGFLRAGLTLSFCEISLCLSLSGLISAIVSAGG